MQQNGYFDANATAPMFPSAREVFLDALDRRWHNPSSLYHEAGAARRALEEAREELAALLGLDEPRRLVFTCGATEANNVVLRHVAATAPADAAVVTSAVEHPSLRAPASALFPGRVHLAPSNLDAHAGADWIRQNRPAFVSVMAANNETGILHPWREIRSHCRELGIPFHSDAAQWIGKLPLDELGACDWVTGSAHKFGGPKGAGFLVIPETLSTLRGSFLGGPQEQGLRAGTENTPALLAMASALTEAESARQACSSAGRDAFESRLRELIPGIRIAGEGHPRLWNTSLVALPEFGNLKWLTRLSHLGFQVSTGSACSSGKNHPSHVLEALGFDFNEMGRVLRASSLWHTRKEDWLALAAALRQVWEELLEPTSESRRKRNVRL